MMGGGFGAVWMIVMVLFWGAIILGVVWLIRGAFASRPGAQGETPTGGEKETPAEILERRFAEGAISAEDYHERREVIATGARGRREPVATMGEGTRDKPEGRRGGSPNGRLISRRRLGGEGNDSRA